MVKIYTKVACMWNDAKKCYEATNDAAFYEYEGNLALCKGDSGGSTASSTTQTSTPWDVQIPYLTQGFQQAQNLFLNTTPQYYPNSTTAPFSPETQTALDLQTMRASTGSPLQPLSTVQGMATLGGAYLPQQNPFNTTLNQDFNDPTESDQFKQSFKAATNGIIPAVDSAFEKSGRLNSGLADTAKTQAIADAFSNMYFQDKSLTEQDRQLRGQNYNSERQNMMSSLMFAPTLENQDYQDIAALGDVGAKRDTMNQQMTTDDVNRFNYSQNIRQQQLQQYMQLISGNYGGTTTSNSSGSTTLPPSNGASSALGGALAGYKLAGGIAGVNPLIGAGIGLLGGGLF